MTSTLFPYVDHVVDPVWIGQFEQNPVAGIFQDSINLNERERKELETVPFSLLRLLVILIALEFVTLKRCKFGSKRMFAGSMLTGLCLRPWLHKFQSGLIRPQKEGPEIPS